MKKTIFRAVLISIFLFPLIVKADIGPKASIEVTINNLDTTNYVIDLLSYDKDGTNYKAAKDYSGSLEGEGVDDLYDDLYKINDHGWISMSSRYYTYMLWSNCEGNKDHKHVFNYLGTPKKYKIVIINYDTGETKISKKIIRTDFNSTVKLNYKNMKVSQSNNDLTNTVKIGLILVLVTALIEVIIAAFFKIKEYKIIAITNVISNILLQTYTIILEKIYDYKGIILVGEIVVIIFEYQMYKKLIKNVDNKKLLKYTIIANLVTAFLTFYISVIIAVVKGY